MPRLASQCKLRVYCDVFHWVNKTFTTALRAQHLVGTLVSSSSVCRSDLRLRGEVEEGFLLCNSFIIAGLPDL